MAVLGGSEFGVSAGCAKGSGVDVNGCRGASSVRGSEEVGCAVMGLSLARAVVMMLMSKQPIVCEPVDVAWCFGHCGVLTVVEVEVGLFTC